MFLELNHNTSKVRQLSEAIQTSIVQGEFQEGDPLPSINTISREYNLARDTVYKAFQELKEKGIIESTPTKGYYVSNTANNIFVLLDLFSSYKNDLYNELTANLPPNYKLDLYFHYFNERFFKNILLDSIGKYNVYVITALANDIYPEILDRLDNSKVLLIDVGKFKKDKFSYICQGFDTTLYECLTSQIEAFRKYKKIVFAFSKNSEHPQTCIPYFFQFCQDNNFEGELITNDITNDNDIQPGTAYLIPRHADMIECVKICRRKNLKLGQDVGLVTFNDTPTLEVIENGISVISTNFKQMGKSVAEYISNRNKIQTYIPTRLIMRGSL